MSAIAPVLCLALLSGAALISCDDHARPGARDAGPSEPSPNASILPAPLASGIEAPSVGKVDDDAGTRGRDGGHAPIDAGTDAAPPEPHALREDQALTADTTHESSGLTLSARFRWLDAQPAPRTPDSNNDALARFRDAGSFDVVVELAGGRMRMAIASRLFTLPPGSELHARDDLYGYALLWPNRRTYTVLSPGALRSTLAEQRADVVPLVRGKFATGASGSLLGFGTERSELSTPTGKLELDQARAPANGTAAWPSGASLCHLLVELVSAPPGLSLCRADLVPMRAEYAWPNGGHLAFEVTRVTRRTDLDAASFAVPPTGAEFRQSELPPPPPTALLSDAELTELRVRAAARAERPDPSAPKTGLLVANHSESLRYVVIDGVIVARLPPGAEQLMLGLRPGKYQFKTCDFFGSEEAAPRTIEVPARVTLGDDSERPK